ncbi:hypothetical protein D6C61_26035, partial [Escherichia coli]|uniref:hypothetical protein n=1 Tax=Escherichia coli TaxID=562 RepID=UPI000FF77F4C
MTSIGIIGSGFGALAVAIELTRAGHTDLRLWERVGFDDGDEQTVDVLVSAVGQLSQPVLPSIPGVDTFEGAAFHSARWDHDVD